MAPHSSTLAWKIPRTEEPGRLQSMGSRRVGHDWATSLLLFTFMHWRRKWQPTPVFLPGESQGQGSPMGCCLWGRPESDTTGDLAAYNLGKKSSVLQPFCLSSEAVIFKFLFCFFKVVLLAFIAIYLNNLFLLFSAWVFNSFGDLLFSGFCVVIFLCSFLHFGREIYVCVCVCVCISIYTTILIPTNRA